MQMQMQTHMHMQTLAHELADPVSGEALIHELTEEPTPIREEEEDG